MSMVSTLAAMPPAVTWRHRWPALGAVVLLGGTALGQFAMLSTSSVDSMTTAAVTSGTESVTAWLFGSLDGGNAITINGPPAALWLMVLSARLFGISTFSLLLPKVLLAVGAVALTWAAVRRQLSDLAGLAAGAAVALATLVSASDHGTGATTLVLFLLAVAGYAVVRALDSGSWLIMAGVALGFGLLTQPATTLLVIPAYGVLYLVAASQPLGYRLRHLAGAVCAMVVSAGWFLLLVAWWPADRRPYVSWWDGGAWHELLTYPGGVGWLGAATVLLLTGAVLWRRRRKAALVLGAVALLVGSLGAVSSVARSKTIASASSSAGTSTAVTNLLSATDSRWSAAVVGEQNAASAMLASNTAVLPLGGSDGTAPAPTLAQFESYVSAGDISYLLLPDTAPTAPPGTAAAQITSWVAAHYSPTTVDGTTVYDLR